MSCLSSPGCEDSQNFQMSSIISLSLASCSLSTQTLCPPQWWLRWSVRGFAPGSFAARSCLRAMSLASAFAKVVW